jgi:hypothetical protein
MLRIAALGILARPVVTSLECFEATVNQAKPYGCVALMSISKSARLDALNSAYPRDGCAAAVTLRGERFLALQEAQLPAVG